MRGLSSPWKGGLAWKRVGTGAHVLQFDGVPLWDVHENLSAGDRDRWWCAPYMETDGAHKVGPFRTCAEAQSFVEERALPWLRKKIDDFIKRGL